MALFKSGLMLTELQPNAIHPSVAAITDASHEASTFPRSPNLMSANRQGQAAARDA
jgi:hypothetical protein